HVCYCPERVLPGNTVAELVNNDRVIGGITPECAQRAAEIYARFSQGKMALTDDRTAEMVKLMENTYRDVNIALANLFGRVAEDVGINAWEAIEYANRHPRVNVLSPGPGVGGHCIPVDPWFLAESFPDHAGLLLQARQINDSQPARVLERLFAVGPLNKGDKIAILGAAYKADIDDPRESPTAHLVEAAEQQGLTVSVHDPLVAAGKWGGMEIINDLDAALEGAAAVVLMTNHKAYRSLSARNLSAKMVGTLVADTRNWLNHAALRRSGFTVLEVGKGEGTSWSFDTRPDQVEWSVGPTAVNGRRTAPTPLPSEREA
ncbi:MAG: nucleotide sugar dehydrogenase, partial [Phycisphaeraceae bacterium]